jgi:phage shock protein PspC (stress-responsive transcriptional regulator)
MKKCPYCAEEIQDEALKCKHCGSWVTTPPGQTWGGFDRAAKQCFRRSAHDRMISGVCGGIGRYFGIDPVWIRVIYAITTIFTAVVPGVITYIVLTFIVPLEDSQV